MKINLNSVALIIGAGLLVAFSSGTVFAQNEKARSILTGKYQGTAKSAGRELTITLELVDNGGAFSGSVTTQHGTFRAS